MIGSYKPLLNQHPTSGNILVTYLEAYTKFSFATKMRHQVRIKLITVVIFETSLVNIF